MRSHDLARRLLSLPDLPVTLSVDLSMGDEESTAGDRAFGCACEINPDACAITICAEDGYLNFHPVNRNK